MQRILCLGLTLVLCLLAGSDTFARGRGCRSGMCGGMSGYPTYYYGGMGTAAGYSMAATNPLSGHINTALAVPTPPIPVAGQSTQGTVSGVSPSAVSPAPPSSPVVSTWIPTRYQTFRGRRFRGRFR